MESTRINVKGIVVQVENMGYRSNIYYHVVSKAWAWYMFNEKDIPRYIVELMNKSKAYKTEKRYHHETKTTLTEFYYKF